MSTEEGPTGPTETSSSDLVSTGPTGDTEIIPIFSLTGGTPEPPRILLSDLLSDVSVLQQQESADRVAFSVLNAPNLSEIRTKMTAWVAGGMQGPCDLVRITMTPPNVCSDGVSRNFFDYIVFVSGKSLAEHIQTFQSILPDFEVGYRCSRSEVVICVVRVKVS
jgi:hypothetical protein